MKPSAESLCALVLVQCVAVEAAPVLPDYPSYASYDYESFQEPLSPLQQAAEEIPFELFGKMCREGALRAANRSAFLRKRLASAVAAFGRFAHTLTKDHENPLVQDLGERLGGGDRIREAWENPIFPCRLLESGVKLREPSGGLAFGLGLLQLFAPK